MIKLIKQSFYKEQELKKELSDFILKTNKFSMGEYCHLFEKSFSEFQRRKYSVFVSSGSAANLILIQSLLNLGYLNKGDVVAVSSLTWATNIMPLIQLGLKPLLIDFNPKTLNISLNNLYDAYKKNKFNALFITNVLGFADKLNEIKQFCDNNNIILLEDNCESLGSEVNHKKTGNFGLASTFSFFVGHHLSTIEGGMVCTDDEELHDMLVMTRAHGWDRNLSIDKQNELRVKYNVNPFFAKYTFYDLAFNVRPTEINGFIGYKTIKYLPEIINKRFVNFMKLNNALKDNDDVLHYELNHMNIISNFAFPLIFKDKTLFIKYKELFEKNNIEIRPIIAGNMTKQPFFIKYCRDDTLLNSRIVDNGFYIPNNPSLNEDELNLLVKLVGGVK